MMAQRITPIPWVEEEKAISFVEIFSTVNLSFSKFGSAERRMFALENNIDKFIKMWVEKQYVLLSAPGRWNLNVMVNNHYVGASYVSMFLDDLYFQDSFRMDAFFELIRKIYAWGKMDHIYVAHNDEFEVKNSFLMGPHQVSGGNRLDQCLPGIYWITVFGPRYIEWFGESKFERLSAFLTERMEDGGRFVMARSGILPYNESQVISIEKKIIKQLGKKAFFDNRHPDRKTISPEFTWRQD